MKIVGKLIAGIFLLSFSATAAVQAGDVSPKFAAADADKDGKLSKDEIVACAKKKADKKAEELFKKLDTNGDASLTKDELKEKKSQKIALNADANGDGKLAKDELVAFTEKRSEEGVSKKFQQVDKDGDGFVTSDEVQQAKSKTKEKPKDEEEDNETEDDVL